MARLRRLERGLRRLGVAELADQDHVRVLAQHALDRSEVRLGVDPDLALVDDAATVLVEDLDRVLDRDDVLVPRAVDVVEHGRERRRLSRARGAGAEDEPTLLLGKARDPPGKAQLLEAGDVLRDDAERERGRAALAKAVDPEAREVLGGIGEVELAMLVKGGALGRDELRERSEDRVEVDLGDRWAAVEQGQRAVATHDGGTADLEMDVARAELDGAPQHGVQFHNGAHRQAGRCA